MKAVEYVQQNGWAEFSGAAGADAAGADAAGADAPPGCPLCTYINELGAANCEICGADL